MASRCRSPCIRNNKLSVFPAIVVFSRETMIGAQFDHMTLRQQSELVRLTFSRADTWASTWGNGEVDTPLAALRDVSLIGASRHLRTVQSYCNGSAVLLFKRRRAAPHASKIFWTSDEL